MEIFLETATNPCKLSNSLVVILKENPVNASSVNAFYFIPYIGDIIRLSFHRLSSNMSTTRISIPIGFDEEIMFEHEIEQCRAQMNNQMDEAIERLNKKKDDLNKQIDDRLESHSLYRNQVDSEVKKQQSLKSIKQIKEISASINLLKEPAMLKFECENNIIFSQIDQIS